MFAAPVFLLQRYVSISGDSDGYGDGDGNGDGKHGGELEVALGWGVGEVGETLAASGPRLALSLPAALE